MSSEHAPNLCLPVYPEPFTPIYGSEIDRFETTEKAARWVHASVFNMIVDSDADATAHNGYQMRHKSVNLRYHVWGQTDYVSEDSEEEVEVMPGANSIVRNYDFHKDSDYGLSFYDEAGGLYIVMGEQRTSEAYVKGKSGPMLYTSISYTTGLEGFSDINFTDRVIRNQTVVISKRSPYEKINSLEYVEDKIDSPTDAEWCVLPEQRALPDSFASEQELKFKLMASQMKAALETNLALYEPDRINCLAGID